MKIRLLIIYLLIVGFANAQTVAKHWSAVDESSRQRVQRIKAKRIIQPQHYFFCSFDIDGLKKDLLEAPKERMLLPNRYAPSSQVVTVSLPTPAGDAMIFNIWEYTMMESKLTVKYSNNKTYAGVCVDDPAIKLRMGYGATGLYASVSGNGISWHIDPYMLSNDQYYMSYDKEELAANQTGFHCQAHAEYAPSVVAATAIPDLFKDLKTFRLALAATGEYTQYWGSKENAMAEIVKLVNRLNQVYENDLCVRLILVNNNDQLVYTNGATDPYTSGRTDLMIDENQTNITTVIGAANYDIGHVVDRSGGDGLASIGVVCKNIYKARGATCATAPTGDPFYIDYVAHEVGHQFGANHTFNAKDYDCIQTNLSDRMAAYEPGSGSTVMGYAGLCGDDNLQNSSNAYFHAKSIFEIKSYILTQSCAATISSANNAPTIDTMPVSGKTIPKSTPFKLVATAKDVDGDNLSFCWEQYNLGLAQALKDTQTSGTSPLFRSYLPATSPTRYFPKLSTIISKTPDPAEQLPGYGRPMTFMLTVRDNHPEGGAVASDSVRFDVAAAAGPFVVNNPPVMELESESNVAISWNVANTNLAPVNCQNVNVWLSIDGGYTYPYLLKQNAANTGNTTVDLPSLIQKSTTCRLVVEAVDNFFFNISPTNFTVNASTVNPAFPEVSADTALYITTNSASLKGTLITDGNEDILETGFYYNTISFTDSMGTKVKTLNPAQSGAFIANVSNLLDDVTYYYRAFATNSVGMAFSNIRSFKTDTIADTIIPPDTTSIVQRHMLDVISIHPNPTTADVIVKTTDNVVIHKVIIKNNMGVDIEVVVFTSGSFTQEIVIDMKAYPKGMYVFVVYTDKGLVFRKILKE